MDDLRLYSSAYKVSAQIVKSFVRLAPRQTCRFTQVHELLEAVAVYLFVVLGLSVRFLLPDRMVNVFVLILLRNVIPHNKTYRKIKRTALCCVYIRLLYNKFVFAFG